MHTLVQLRYTQRFNLKPFSTWLDLAMYSCAFVSFVIFFPILSPPHSTEPPTSHLSHASQRPPSPAHDHGCFSHYAGHTSTTQDAEAYVKTWGFQTDNTGWPPRRQEDHTTPLPTPVSCWNSLARAWDPSCKLKNGAPPLKPSKLMTFWTWLAALGLERTE